MHPPLAYGCMMVWSRRAVSLFDQIVKFAEIGRCGLAFSALAFLDDLDDAVIDGRGNAVFAPLLAYDAVDCINLAGLSFFDVLQHGWLNCAMLFHGNGDQERGKRALDGAFVINGHII